MHNIRNTSVNIINISAEKLANPTGSIAAKILGLQYIKWEAELDILSPDEELSYAATCHKDEIAFSDREKKRVASLEKTLDELNNPDARTDFYKIIEEERDSLYSSSLPVSLDILKLNGLIPRELYTTNKKSREQKTYDDIFSEAENEKIYTDAIINVTFDMALYAVADEFKFVDKIVDETIKKVLDYKGKKIADARNLRQRFYDEGVTLRFGDSLVQYVKYKRSSSKAREGSHLFIKKELKGKMNDWDVFGIYYNDTDKNVPLAAIKAYESLTSSGIIKIVEIHPNEILLINDVNMEVKIKASVTTELENGDIVAEDNDEYMVTNIIWDGQSLADTSLFDEEPDGQKGMMLLRNSFFKSCGFNTNIQKWFDDKSGDDKKEFISDMFGRKVKRTDIKLITTPSSLKFLKFYDKFPGADVHEKRKNCYEKWLDTISDGFGVCKHESASRFGKSQQLSYQIVNSLPLNEEKIKALLEDDLQHIKKMKGDVNYFKSIINLKAPQPSETLMLRLLNVNNKMWDTNMVKDYVRDKVDNYIADLRKGHVKVEGSDYAVLFGNPLEMLQYALNGKIKEVPLTGKQVYCSRYDNGEKLAGFRNPHITMGNVLVVENVRKEAFSTYFNLTKNIVISNAYDNDIMCRLQGQDYDGDTLLLCSYPILVKAAEACQNDKFRVPINGIEAENKERKYTIEDEVDIDHKTARNKIGEIVNLSQILNSYYWDCNSKNRDGQNDGLLKEYYNQISILSSLSQIEIDRAKKDYKTNTGTFLKKLRDRRYNTEFLLKRDKKRFKKESLCSVGPEDGDMLEDSFSSLDDSIKKKRLCLRTLCELIDSIKTMFPHENDKNQAIKAVESVGNEIFRDWCAGGAHDEFDAVRLDEKKIKVLKQLKHFLTTEEREVLIRPKFLEYCGGRGKYSFKYFETSMDYLQQIIDDIPNKKRTKTVDIVDIIPKPDFRKADNHQLPKIIEDCTKADKRIKALRYKQDISDEIKYSKIREAENEVIQKLKKRKINDNTIRIIFYRAFSENEKYRDKKYSMMKRHLAGWLYQAHSEIFEQVIAMSKEK